MRLGLALAHGRRLYVKSQKPIIKLIVLLKEYLSTPPVLRAFRRGSPFTSYIIAKEVVSVLCCLDAEMSMF